MNRRSICGICWIRHGRVLLIFPSIICMLLRCSCLKLCRAIWQSSGCPSSVYTCDCLLFEAK